MSNRTPPPSCSISIRSDGLNTERAIALEPALERMAKAMDAMAAFLGGPEEMIPRYMTRHDARRFAQIVRVITAARLNLDRERAAYERQFVSASVDRFDARLDKMHVRERVVKADASRKSLEPGGRKHVTEAQRRWAGKAVMPFERGGIAGGDHS